MTCMELQAELNIPHDRRIAENLIRILVERHDGKQPEPEILKRRLALIEGGIWYIDGNGNVTCDGRPIPPLYSRPDRHRAERVCVNMEPWVPDARLTTYHFFDHELVDVDFYHHM